MARVGSWQAIGTPAFPPQPMMQSSPSPRSVRWWYLPPPSRPDKPLAVKTLIVPTQEYSEGRHVTLTTGRSVYTVALRHLVEQRADWSWAAIQIVEKKSRV